MQLGGAERGQSVVVGSVLMFVVIISLLGIAQTFIVPQANSVVELNHADEADSDFSETYESINRAAITESTTVQSIKLGTNYPSRLVLINPPPVSGEIQTVEYSNDFTLTEDPPGFDEEDLCGTGTTKRLQYQANYNELQDSPIHVYEMSVRYKLNENGDLIDSRQSLVSGDQIQLIPLTTGSISIAKTSAQDLRFVPGERRTREVEDPTLEFPSRLTVSQWQDVLPSSASVTVSQATDGDIVLKFDGHFRFTCGPVGIDDEPSNTPNVPKNPGGGASPDSGAINPVGPNDLVLTDASSGSPWTATFHNNDNQFDKEVVAVRIPYVIDDGNSVTEATCPGDVDGAGTQLTVTRADDGTGLSCTTVTVGEGFRLVNQPSNWIWEKEGTSGDTATVEVDGLHPQNNGFAIVYKFDDGNTSTYFIHDTT